MDKNIVVTISRQMGSGGFIVGRRLAERLGYQYVDREILRKATEYLGEEEAVLEGREERLSGFWESVIGAFFHGAPEAAYIPPPIRPVYDSELFNTESLVMKDIAEKYNAVIVGRCGFHVLRGHPGLINIFLHAPRAFRVKVITEAYKLTAAGEAISLIEESDYRRGRYVNAMAGVKWTDARNYHLCIDTSAAGFESAEQMISELVGKMKKEFGVPAEGEKK